MTIRRSQSAGVTPGQTAEEVAREARSMFPGDPALQAGTGISLPGVEQRYEEFFDQFTALVCSRVRHAGRGFVLEVAEHAGVAPADWYRLAMREVDSGRDQPSAVRSRY